MKSSHSGTEVGSPLTPHTQHLLTLLSRWPRQSLSRWLLAGDGEVAKLQRRALPTQLTTRLRPNKGFLAPADAAGVGVVGITDGHYPALIRQIPDPPLVLFYKGSLEALKRPCVAVVGARRCSSNGRILAQQLSADLAARGVCVVSGLALGIDTAAHSGVFGQRASTAAFLGCGLDQIYPRSNINLAQRIVDQHGVLVSEYPLGTPPLAHHFPERNRLISGAAAAVVLIEAGEKSGSLITARMALEQGREVFAVPGPALSELNRGCHRLIQQGAGLVVCAQDVLDNMPMLATRAVLDVEGTEAAASSVQLSRMARSILRQLDGYGQCLDDIAAALKQNPQEVSLAMVELELAGFVRLGGDGYIRAS